MTPDEIQAAGRALFGYWWRSSFCQRFRLNSRTLRHMLAGKQEVPAGLVGEIKEAVNAVRQ